MFVFFSFVTCSLRRFHVSAQNLLSKPDSVLFGFDKDTIAEHCLLLLSRIELKQRTAVGRAKAVELCREVGVVECLLARVDRGSQCPTEIRVHSYLPYFTNSDLGKERGLRAGR